MMFLAIQNNYDELQIALMRNTHCIDVRTISKLTASRDCIPTLNALLDAHSVTLKEIQCIAVNQGPGPFTTLRVVIASANGLSFASKIPLIGIDGLHALMSEYADDQYACSVGLLNAFNQDVYFAFAAHHEIKTGYGTIDTVLSTLREKFPQTIIRFIGNGTVLYQEKIKKFFGENAFIPEPTPLYCTVQQIGLMALAQWHKNGQGCTHLSPLYLKRATT